MGEDIDGVTISTDVIIIKLYVVSIYFMWVQNTFVLALTGYGIGVGTILAVLGPDSVETPGLVHNLYMIATETIPSTDTRVHGGCVVTHEEMDFTTHNLIVDVKRTNPVSLIGKDGIRQGTTFSTSSIIANIGEPVGGFGEAVLTGSGSLSSNGGIAGGTDTPRVGYIGSGIVAAFVLCVECEGLVIA